MSRRRAVDPRLDAGALPGSGAVIEGVDHAPLEPEHDGRAYCSPLPSPGSGRDRRIAPLVAARGGRPRLPPSPARALGRARAADGGGLHARLPRAGAGRATCPTGTSSTSTVPAACGCWPAVYEVFGTTLGVRARRRLRSSSSASCSACSSLLRPWGPLRRRRRAASSPPSSSSRRSGSPPWRGSAASPSASGRSARRRRLAGAARRSTPPADRGRAAGRRRAARRRRAALPARPRRRHGRARWRRRAVATLAAPRRRLLPRRRRPSACSPYLVHLAMAGPGNVDRGHVHRAGVRPPRRTAPAAAAVARTTSTGSSSGPATLDRAAVAVPRAAGRRRQLSAVAAAAASPAWRPAGRRRAAAPRRDAATAACSSSAAFAVGLLPQALQRADSTHLAWVSCVALRLPARRRRRAARLGAAAARTREPVAAVAVPVVLLLALVPHFTLPHLRRLRRPDVRHAARRAADRARGGRSFHYGRRDAVDAVNELLADRRRAHRARRPPVRRHRRPPQDALQRGVPLLPAPRPRRRRPATSRWTPASPTPTTPAWPTSSRAADVVDPLVDPRRLGRAERLARRSGPTSRTRCSSDDFCLVGSYGDGLVRPRPLRAVRAVLTPRLDVPTG